MSERGLWEEVKGDADQKRVEVASRSMKETHDLTSETLSDFSSSTMDLWVLARTLVVLEVTVDEERDED